MTVVATFLILSAAAIVWILAAPGLRRWRRLRMAARPVPPGWDKTLSRHLPIYRRLPPRLRQRLVGLMQVFLAEKPIVGCAGLQLTDDMRLSIAAQACVLLLNRDFSDYDGLDAVLVYPGGFVSRHDYRNEAGLHVEEVRALSGESWESGKVILSWEDVDEGARDACDGNNVVYHEFAHQLDQASGIANGAPPLPDETARRRWAEVWSQAYDLMRHHHGSHGRQAPLRAYAGESPAEFFAVATEFFFEAPQRLREAFPALYEQLVLFYRLDPGTWI
jgi:hypothetical protein